ncbi:hypothetical protein BS50DRAFT_90800 [Corynespora cassiicola Philippines]|uniref:Uncharacterized protein n=1 Tax=Corynespora cassiicola Philippines TaxID=1448308 RepID=A0A2T2NEI7_CORCC|nr:hypothetical protein BS50DRAFT_90800 [Corynespora cassiicola Philippines]
MYVMGQGKKKRPDSSVQWSGKPRPKITKSYMAKIRVTGCRKKLAVRPFRGEGQVATSHGAGVGIALLHAGIANQANDQKRLVDVMAHSSASSQPRARHDSMTKPQLNTLCYRARPSARTPITQPPTDKRRGRFPSTTHTHTICESLQAAAVSGKRSQVEALAVLLPLQRHGHAPAQRRAAALCDNAARHSQTLHARHSAKGLVPLLFFNPPPPPFSVSPTSAYVIPTLRCPVRPVLRCLSTPRSLRVCPFPPSHSSA